MSNWKQCLSRSYEASDSGEVRRIGSLRLLSKSLNGVGYWKVSVCDDGHEETVSVHSLVAEAFLGPRPDGFHVNHIDGDKRNNRPANLEYVTPSDNAAHASRMGLSPSGSRHGRHTKPHRTARGERVNTAKMTAASVRIARALRADGWTLPSLCARFKISKSAMHSIVTGKNWGHV